MKHKCQVCNRDIDDVVGMAHAKAEEYLLNLIRRDHPEWKETEATCPKCLEYYRRLVKETEI
jgi:hypothetical protein